MPARPWITTKIFEADGYGFTPPSPSLGLGLGTFSYAFGLGALFCFPPLPLLSPWWPWPPQSRECPLSPPALLLPLPWSASGSESESSESEDDEDDSSSLDSPAALGLWYMQQTL